MTNATAMRERISRRLLKDIDETRFPSAAMLDRAEAELNSPDDLGNYVEALVKRFEAMTYPSIDLLNRLQGLVTRLERLESQQAARSQRDGSGEDNNEHERDTQVA